MTLAVGTARGLRALRGAGLVRSIGVGVAALLLSANVFIMRPLLDQAAGAYRDAARAGESARALELRDAYDERHAVARALLTTLTGVVAVALVAAVVGVGRPRTETPTAQGSGRWHDEAAS
jgi:hypothetical protein